MKKNKRVRKPNALIYHGTYILTSSYYRRAYGLTTDKTGISGLKPPFLVVSGHSCWLDYMIAFISMYPYRMNYVAAYNFFRNRILNRLLCLMGAISKYQFKNDLKAVKKMKQVIDRGGIVTIYPYGCLSNDGRPGGFAAFGIAKLIKFLKVPVVALQTNGGYLTRPRWTKQARRGVIQTKVFQVLSRDEVSTLSEEEIYSRIIESIYFDDYRWQREHMKPYNGKNLAEGVEYVLYKCPKCESEFTLRSKNDLLFCTRCNNTVRMNKYLMFEPINDETAYFDAIDGWYDFQSEHLRKEIMNPGFELVAETELRYDEPGKFGYQHRGFGTVRLTTESITYSGLVAGESRELVFPMKNIIMIPYAAGDYIEIATDEAVERFIFKDPRSQIKWVMAVRLIRDMYYEKAYNSKGA